MKWSPNDMTKGVWNIGALPHENCGRNRSFTNHVNPGLKRRVKSKTQEVY